MRSPFPGMNPYLEQPIFWSEFHSRLIVAIADALAPSLLPKYYIIRIDYQQPVPPPTLSQG